MAAMKAAEKAKKAAAKHAKAKAAQPKKTVQTAKKSKAKSLSKPRAKPATSGGAGSGVVAAEPGRPASLPPLQITTRGRTITKPTRFR